MEDTRLRWTSDQIKYFLECCVEELSHSNGKKDGTLSKPAWTNILKKMQDTFKRVYEQKQLKNQYDYMKLRYRAWCFLKSKTGNTYCSATNTFHYSDEQWDEFSEVHPKAKTLRSSPLLFPDLCAAVYDKTYATGARARSVSSSRATGSSSSIPQFQLQDEEDDDNESTHDVQSIPSFSLPNEEEANATEPTHNTSDVGREDEGPSKQKKRRKKDEKIDIVLEKASKALDSVMSTNMNECATKLNSIGLDELDPLYCAAFEIFTHSVVYRDAWMTLPANPELLKRWIRNTAVKLKILD